MKTTHLYSTIDHKRGTMFPPTLSYCKAWHRIKSIICNMAFCLRLAHGPGHIPLCVIFFKIIKEIRDFLFYLLWRDIKRHCPKVNLLILICTGQDEEKARPLGSSSPESPQPEYNSPLILLHNLNSEEGWSGQKRSSLITLTHMQREKGMVTRNKTKEKAVRIKAMIPGPSGSAEIDIF